MSAADDDQGGEVVRTVTINIVTTSTGGRLFNVCEGDRIADMLAFDEMLGQIVSMLYPGPLQTPRYRMEMPVERAAREARHEERLQELRREKASKPDPAVAQGREDVLSYCERCGEAGQEIARVFRALEPKDKTP